jgi:hypothetical protein
MKKKVNIVTYCAGGSIGSILQAYALTHTLQENGYESAVWLEDWNRNLHIRKPRSFMDHIKKVYKSIYGKRILSAHQKRMAYISAHMETEYFPNWEAFQQKALENPNHIYLAGSDQVWNPDKVNPIFFLDFVGTSKRISYAASMGNTRITSEKAEQMRKWLHAFDHISVREQECLNALAPLTDKDISVHIDPTFLVDVEVWRGLEKNYKVKGPYILLYMLYWDDSFKKQIIALKKRTGLPVYAVCPDMSRVYADRHLYDVGVEEFLWLVDHAEYVVTSSFHGVAFSILFQKKFAPMINPRMPSRIENVLNVLGVPKVGMEELDSTDHIDYEAVAANIEKEKQRSIAYLKEAIE